ncbi:RidA family protein [Scleromatobacter humisilvae]|uniref:Rid family detoxifying hydrolase n=1 Tax=Scleromatobacter humisilvae TaxID=2897159 RepID=A0A9X1YIG0_9BURK|nr:Rid family detoxifying hydrolase [Scleromatobacter humisilvae]MCK9686753.1 Rid family detoxifying hydrolase [Scleromatobacter humisilvae]
MNKYVLLVVASVLSVGAQAETVEFLNPPGLMAKGLPFSPAVRVGGQVYVTGQIGTTPGTTTLVSGGMAAEAKQSIQNIKSILEANGYALRDVVKCTVMLADMSEWAAFNEVYKSAFTPPYPARSAFGANGLAFGAKVELDCIAAR